MNIGLKKLDVFYEEEVKPFEPGIVFVEPLGKGLGHTLGVSLRRTMLRYMPGVSVIGIQIPGVNHEFTSVPGTATDVTTLIKYLKKVRFSFSDGEEGMRTISVSTNERGIFTAGDLSLPSGVEVQNPDQELLNVLGKEEVELDIFVKMGRGYVDAKQHKEWEKRPDVIPVDGTFSPVRLVGYEIEDMRIAGEEDGYERLILTVETDGSILPKDAVMVAAKIHQELFSFFDGMSDIATKTEVCQEKKEEEEEDLLLNQHIEMLNLSPRSYNCLKNNNYLLIRDVVKLSEQDLLNIRNLGKLSVEEIVTKLEQQGLSLAK